MAVTGRHCGDCRMCCKYLYVGEKGTLEGVPYEFVKYPGTWCEHTNLKPGLEGCKLHGSARMPLACRSFQCLWLMGIGDEADRPDKIKVIASLEPRAPADTMDELRAANKDGACFITVYDCAPRARYEDRAARFIHALEMFYAEDGIEGMEFVPFKNTWADRMAHSKKLGWFVIRLNGWPAHIDADVEREEMKRMFGGEVPDDISMADLSKRLEELPPDVRTTIIGNVIERWRVRQAGGS